MKKILFLVAVFLTLAFTVVVSSTQVLIIPSSRLLIKGETNVSTFKCQFDILKLEKPISVHFKRVGDKIVFDNTILVLKNNCFDCGGRLINKDFQKLLKSEVYPKTRIKLKEIYRNANNRNDVIALLDITIAGVTKSHRLPVTIKGEEKFTIEGILDLNICDFNLEPPKKAMGLIVVDENIQINFQLMVEEY